MRCDGSFLAKLMLLETALFHYATF